MEATIAREPGNYTVNLRRLTAGPPITVLVAPALPLGARVELVVVNDANITVQIEESAHDVHALAEVVLDRDTQVEFHFTGGLEIVSPQERVDIGGSSRELKVLTVRRTGRDYFIDVEGLAGIAYSLELRTQSRVRAIQGSDSFEQKAGRVAARFTMPAGTDFVRKTLRVRT